MQYIIEKPLSDFEFWSGGKDSAKLLTKEQLDALEPHLPELIGETPTDTNINDLFWFDFETVCEAIGLVYTEDGDVVEKSLFDEIDMALGEADTLEDAKFLLAEYGTIVTEEEKIDDGCGDEDSEDTYVMYQSVKVHLKGSSARLNVSLYYGNYSRNLGYYEIR